MGAIKTLEYKGYKINIFNDEDPQNTRTEWDNVGKMICSHNRYTLGDEEYNHSYANNWDENKCYYFAENYSNDIINFINDKHNYNLTFIPDELNSKMIKLINEWLDSEVYILPLNLYDHSGISMSTGSFSCRWDSGCVGFIFATKTDAKAQYGEGKGDFNSFDEKALSYLDDEVKTYNDYLTNNVYGYTVEDEDGYEIASCWGYYGYDEEKSGLKDATFAEIDCDIKNNGLQERREEAEKELTERELKELARLKLKYPNN